jgi:citrate synthase
MKKTTAELFEKRTGVKYQNWIQAWAVTEKQKRKNKMNMKPVIKTGLWMMSIVCLYNILTTFDTLVFAVSGFVGLVATWMLIKWDELVE